MAYTDENFAVLPLGCSCQTNHQINAQISLIGDVLRASYPIQLSTYFDWIIAPSGSTLKLIEAGLPLPESLDEIGWACGKPEWVKENILFYHEFIDPWHNYYSSQEGLDSLRGKFSYTASNLKTMAQAKKTIFMWSNSQNNLDHVSTECANLDVVLTYDAVDKIMRAGDILSSGQASYVFVTYEDRHALDLTKTIDRAQVHVIARDESGWEGDEGEWARVFRTFNPS
ncbi:hypothetical protein WG907_02505 [Sphingobium sp. AN558]|uniref:hypothetical protein n=1 Tax=Sphingobium sp. AN558 TaxID=3133442 RepID=UPI0030BAE46E